MNWNSTPIYYIFFDNTVPDFSDERPFDALTSLAVLKLSDKCTDGVHLNAIHSSIAR